MKSLFPTKILETFFLFFPLLISKTDFENEEREHEPSNVDGHQKLEKATKLNLHKGRQPH